MSEAEHDAFLDHRFALDALDAAAALVAAPELVYKEWFDLTLALLVHQQLPHYTTFEVMAVAARSVARDVLHGV